MLCVHQWLASSVQYLEHSLLLLVTLVSDLAMCTIKLCSVVFAVTLRLLAINTSSSISYQQQKHLLLPAMSVANLQLSVSSAAARITLGGCTTDNTL